jgi:hypothetical protein
MLVHETAGAIRGMQLEPAGLVVACRRIVERHPTSGPLWWFCASILTSTDPFRAALALASDVENDPTPDQLVDLIPADAAVAVVGWPDLIGDAVLRRGDIRVLVVDADDHGMSFLRRLHRSDIDAELVAPAGVASAALAADVVLVEAMAAGALGGSELLASPPSRALAATAYCAEIPVWAVAGHGRRLPGDLLACMADRLTSGARPWDAPAESLPIGLVGSVVGPSGAVASDAADALAAECPMAYELVRASPM